MQKAKLTLTARVNGREVVVYAYAYLEWRIPHDPYADFSVGIREIEIYRVSVNGKNVIDELTEVEFSELQAIAEAHARETILHQ